MEDGDHGPCMAMAHGHGDVARRSSSAVSVGIRECGAGVILITMSLNELHFLHLPRGAYIEATTTYHESTTLPTIIMV